MTAASSRTMSRRARKKMETRMRILDAAFSLMQVRGYEDVKVEEIAKRADVANATFFLHFPTKASLVVAFNEQVSMIIAERLAEFDLPAVEQLELLRAIVLDEWGRHADLLRQMVSDVAAQGGDELGRTSASLTQLVREIIEKGQQAGDFSAEYDADIAAQSLAASWRAVTLHWASHGDAEKARDANRQVLDLLLNGLIKR